MYGWSFYFKINSLFSNSFFRFIEKLQNIIESSIPCIQFPTVIFLNIFYSSNFLGSPVVKTLLLPLPGAQVWISGPELRFCMLYSVTKNYTKNFYYNHNNELITTEKVTLPLLFGTHPNKWLRELSERGARVCKKSYKGSHRTSSSR